LSHTNFEMQVGAPTEWHPLQIMKPKFFSSAEQFHNWLLKNHAKKDELLIGFHKKASGKKSITYPEALDEALCFGWIDGVRQRLNETSYTQRFTPRRAKSIWSRINVNHVERLRKEGRMQEAGLAEFAKRDEKRTGVYAFENAPRELSPEFQKEFQANKKAWESWKTQPTYFKKVTSFWVMSAKKEETQLRRLNRLIESLEKGERLGMVVPKAKK
jgi:uncharacterized protein YdeI (YjbR/CyaY-like superfamily)